jgi:hypothetical protein
VGSMTDDHHGGLLDDIGQLTTPLIELSLQDLYPPGRRGTGLRPKDDGVGAGSGRHLALRKMISPSIEKKSSLQDLYPPSAGEERNILWCCNLPAASVTINGICGPAASARGQGGR